MYGRSDSAYAFKGSQEHCMKDVSRATDSRYPRRIQLCSILVIASSKPGPRDGPSLSHAAPTGHCHQLIFTSRSSFGLREQAH